MGKWCREGGAFGRFWKGSGGFGMLSGGFRASRENRWSPDNSCIRGMGFIFKTISGSFPDMHMPSVRQCLQAFMNQLNVLAAAVFWLQPCTHAPQMLWNSPSHLHSSRCIQGLSGDNQFSPSPSLAEPPSRTTESVKASQTLLGFTHPQDISYDSSCHPMQCCPRVASCDKLGEVWQGL